MQDALFEAEEKLQQVQKDFERMKDEFQDFIYVVSHDLRGPLRHASGFGEMLLDMNESVLDEKSKKFLNIIIDSAEGGKRSIDSLQKYSRLIFNVQAPEDNINPNGILDDIAASMNPLVPENFQATIQYQDLPLIRGDAAQLTQLFECLVQNALRYHVGDKPIVISVDCEDQKKAWHFSISDNGIGVPNGQLDYVFGVFKRAVKDADYPGEGMGLAMAKKIVERHRGEVWFTPEVAEGAKINFTIAKGLQD